MPAAHESYSVHSCKASSSQMSLPNQVQASTNPPTSRSTTFLPATTYTESSSPPVDSSDGIISPDSFYRQFHKQYAQSSGAPLTQSALRTTDLDTPVRPANGRTSSFASTLSLEDRRATYENGYLPIVQDSTRSYTASPGLRGRKASVKNLVAQINATAHEEMPPLPLNSLSRTNSRNVSPILLSNSQFQASAMSQIPVDNVHPDSLLQYESRGPHAQHGFNNEPSEMKLHSHRPLFGEVISGASSSATAGYGIQSLRPRAGSEGSPLRSPNMSLVQQTTETTMSNSVDGVHAPDPNFTLSAAVYSAPKDQSRHRKVRSESPLTPTSDRNDTTTSKPFIQITKHQARGHGTSSREIGQNMSSGEKTRTSPRRRHRSPPAIQSPGQRGRKPIAGQADKSPSLRANIIVPPPKVSPPLRSSRPRLPVSSASTAASRAKMAEKFSTMQKLNNEKRQAARKNTRPPELSDIDLKARRLRITQALSRSLEGQDLKGGVIAPKFRDTSRSRTASPTSSDISRNTEPLTGRTNVVPAVVIDMAAADTSTPENQATPDRGTPRESAFFAQNALDAMQGSPLRRNTDEDSPTVGSGFDQESSLPPLLTNVRSTDQNREPWSALTDATEHTTIDPEPQEDTQPGLVGRSILSQINDFRGSDTMRQASYDTFSDNGDQESVQLILRDTMYLDDEEAIRKGYRQALPLTYPAVGSSEVARNLRSSWTSSLEDSDHGEGEPGPEEMNQETIASSRSNVNVVSPQNILPRHNQPDDSVRSTMASDAYTIVNIVLQQHSTSGIVDQQFVDDVYQRILEDSPYDDEGSLTQERIEQMCLREIQDREESWFRPTEESEPVSPQSTRNEEDVRTPTKRAERNDPGRLEQDEWVQADVGTSSLAPPVLKGHKYKSSLDSAEDWADTSPSISDWMVFAANDATRASVDQKSQINSAVRKAQSITNANVDDTRGASLPLQDEDSDLYSAPAPRAPSHSPPPVPTEQMPSIEQTSFGTAIIERPSVPRRITSLSQMDRRQSLRGRSLPSTSAPVIAKVSLDEPITPEQRRLKQRRHVIKELVDTEFTYEKDLRVLCDIYKQTASAALGDDDIRVLFGNVEQIQEFSKDFLMVLKSFARPTYKMERPERKKERDVSRGSSSIRPSSSSSTLASAKNFDTDLPSAEKDHETRIGQAFEASLLTMEKVYTEYIKNRHAANLRLEAIQKSHSAREWLKECKENSSDITNAWNLDALLVKPVQRITKYPLLLKELIDSSSEGHPDLPFLRRSMQEVTDINMRINDVKKHAELVDQVLNRKRKDSDVRAGLSKAFGRRAEKLKQQVGMTEMYEDTEYNEIKIHYDNNIVQLMVVGNDCNSYGRAVTKWVNKMVEIAAAAEAWVDVGHSHNQEAQSRLRQFAMVVRGVNTIALPNHLEQLTNKVLTPMQQAVDLMTRFKTDPKGLLQKREKRMIDYAQIKSKKDRGEKVDKKMIERMEQSEALNVEAKERMRKLIKATAQLVQGCQANLVQMQVTWQGMVKQKLSAATGIPLDHLDIDDIEKEWQMDFDYQEASALSLGICNGSLLAEAINMVNIHSTGTTLTNGQESPRQGSFTSASKRSISLASTNDSAYHPIPEYDPRTSGSIGHHFREPSLPFANGRSRTQSATSGKFMRSPDLSNPAQYSGTSDGFGMSSFGRSDDNMAAPRLSVETPSPLIGLLQPEPSTRRPGSASTFFSATATPPLQQHQSTGSSIFSSAMPMSDSPTTERQPELHESKDPDVLFTAASVYEFNIDRSRREAGFPYLTYVTGEIFDIIGERGELWLAKNQDDPQKQIGWIWNKHFAKLAE